MNPPKVIKLAGTKIEVCKLPAEFEGVDCGQFLSYRNRIDLSGVLAPDVERNTLLHELVHAMLFYGGLRETLSKRDEELLCNSLAMMLLGILRENPSLVRYFTERD